MKAPDGSNPAGRVYWRLLDLIDEFQDDPEALTYFLDKVMDPMAQEVEPAYWRDDAKRATL